MTAITYDHTHVMEWAIRTTCPYGFILRDLKHEFISRFADELLLRDTNAKAVGSQNTAGRARLGACIGEGNSHFLKYSLFLHVYLLLHIIVEEARKEAMANQCNMLDNDIEILLSRKPIYTRLKAFPKEISAVHLATTAR
mgnify:CR=1 FL=1